MELLTASFKIAIPLKSCFAVLAAFMNFPNLSLISLLVQRMMIDLAIWSSYMVYCWFLSFPFTSFLYLSSFFTDSFPCRLGDDRNEAWTPLPARVHNETTSSDHLSWVSVKLFHDNFGSCCMRGIRWIRVGFDAMTPNLVARQVSESVCHKRAFPWRMRCLLFRSLQYASTTGMLLVYTPLHACIIDEIFRRHQVFHAVLDVARTPLASCNGTSSSLLAHLTAQTYTQSLTLKAYKRFLWG